MYVIALVLSLVPLASTAPFAAVPGQVDQVEVFLR